MNLKPIPIDQLQVKAHDAWANGWFLLTAGDFQSGQYNTMTVAWGALGTMWARPFAMVVVRPHRYTYEFMEASDTFTLCSFPEQYHKALSYLGSHSGRDENKIARSGLTPAAASQVSAPVFTEANLILECRKIYYQDLSPEHFLDEGILNNYKTQDYHRMYFGQILAAFGDSQFDSLGETTS